jgi:hypothetical protein
MFRNLPPAEFVEKDLIELGKQMVSNAPLVPENKIDPAESKTPAGYTYLGQFIAHDLTFDPASSLQHENDPDALVDFRTPRFDLDCMYGRGPADQPYLYESDDVRLVMGEELQGKNHRDVPRSTSQRAIIGDPRNDENVIISQMHGLFMRFHNRMASISRDKFEAVQQTVRWHYQWVVLYDFLRRIVNPDTYNEVLPHVRKKSNPFTDRPNLRLYKVRDRAYLPIEFSAAAYRFGHSTVRRRYRLNTDPQPGVSGPFEVLGEKNPLDDLRGFRSFQTNWAIQWELFFEGLSGKRVQKPLTKHQVQRAHKIGTQLSEPLSRLPRSIASHGHIALLSQRNLLRGWRLGLPSGQAVSVAMGIEPIRDANLKIGRNKREAVRLVDRFPRFSGNAPLWYYVLAEAQHEFDGEYLGPVGGRIVMETFVGLMLEDGCSLLRQNPLWKPHGVKGWEFGMPELIKMAIHD